MVGRRDGRDSVGALESLISARRSERLARNALVESASETRRDQGAAATQAVETPSVPGGLASAHPALAVSFAEPFLGELLGANVVDLPHEVSSCAR